MVPVETLPSNSRISLRQKTLKSAKIVLDDWRVIDCAVRDISETGAKIQVDGPLNMPEKFRLLMITENTIRPVSVVRRSSTNLGVVFLGPATRAPARKL
jgi:PilZ domain